MLLAAGFVLPLAACTSNPCLELMLEQARYGKAPDCVYRMADPEISDWQLQQRKRYAEKCKDRSCLQRKARIIEKDRGIEIRY
jgi:hypothetical protein